MGQPWIRLRLRAHRHGLTRRHRSFLFTLPFLAMRSNKIFPEDEFMRETRARHECCDRAAIDRFILSEVAASSRLFDKCRRVRRC